MASASGSLALSGLGALGALLHIAGSVMIVFGQASVKVAHSIVDSTGAPSTWSVPPHGPHPPLWRRPDGKWRRQKAGSKAYSWGGWGAFALGNVLRFVAMRFAAQTVLSGLGSLQFVLIPVASRFMLGIRASAHTALGVSVVLAGNALILMYGPAEVTFTLPQLRRQWATPAMTTLLVVLGGLLCALQYLHWRLSRAGGPLLQPQPQLAASMRGGGGGMASNGVGGGGGFEVDSPTAAALDADRQHLLSAGSGKWLAVPAPPGLAGPGWGGPLGGLGGRDADTVAVFGGALLFSAVASFVGAWSVLFSKSLAYVFSYMPASLTDWYSWFVLAAFLATAAFWVRQSDRGLRVYPASLIMPLMQASAFWMCMSVLEGGIYFEELASLPPRHLTLLMLGLLLALLGAISMGVAGFVAEKPEHILLYSAANHELSAVDGGPLSPPPKQLGVIVERLHATSGRVDRKLSSPVLRPVSGGGGNGSGGAAHRNGFSSGGSDLEAGKRWWQREGGSGGGDVQLHAVASPPGGLSLELPSLGGSSTPLALSPGAFARMEAVVSPTQQLLSRENSISGGGGGGGLALRNAFDRALQEVGGAADTVLMSSRGTSPRSTLQRR